MFLRTALVALLSILSFSISADTLTKEVYDSRPGYGYSRAVKVGDFLYLSGVVGSGTMPEAIKGAYDSIRKTLKAHGLEFKHIVKETIYTTQMDALKESKEVRKQYYGEEFPAATWVQIDRLFKPKFTIEVDVIAYFPNSEN